MALRHRRNLLVWQWAKSSTDFSEALGMGTETVDLGINHQGFKSHRASRGKLLEDCSRYRRYLKILGRQIREMEGS